ncbi:MAG: aldo/keto reductase family oxidoreductase [Lachnospiraceae bacterium]|uniref:aldo/keto reductase n=1 Tax=Parablautia sp. Marseille-Q6255 TaxID=3039593 RepID=UPI0024BD2C61|nr:aldo/keto reductase [Parablautia sp. Marseille-Q6255]
MKYVNWGSTDKKVPAIALGCMRMSGIAFEEAVQIVEKALEQEVTFFDHADIYGGGACETVFGKVMREIGCDREKLFIQSKCGIVPGVMYDFSKEHILEAVDGSLKRLGVDYLDALLLHRPDTLMEPEEVAEAFDELERRGKVRYFGVSNQTPMQMELMKKCVRQPLCADQVQFGLAHAGMIRSGFEANMMTDGAVDRDGGILDYCRLHDMTVQAWSPFQYGMFEGVFFKSEAYARLNKKLDEIAAAYGVTNTTIAVAWILRHPANIQVLAGTMNPSRLEEICQAAQLRLTKEEWYALYRAAGNILP